EEILDVIAEGDKEAKEPEPAPKAEEKKPEPKTERAAAQAQPETPARTERTSSPDVKVGAVPANELDFLRSVTSAPSIKVPAGLQQKSGNDAKVAATAAPAAAAAPPPPPPPAPVAVEAPKKKEAAEPVAVAFEAAPG